MHRAKPKATANGASVNDITALQRDFERSLERPGAVAADTTTFPEAGTESSRPTDNSDPGLQTADRSGKERRRRHGPGVRVEAASESSAALGLWRDACSCHTDAMELAPGISVDDDVLTAFCRTNGVRRLGLFGSALRGELQPDSDIDLLVEFSTGRVPGLLRIAALELELAELLGRDVDLRTPGDLSRRFRDEVSASARVLYDAA